MKILHYINNLGSGGAEKLLSDILPLMQNEGHEVSIVISNNLVNTGKYEKIIQDGGVQLISLNKSFYNPLQIFKMIAIVRKGRFDIVHAHLFPSQYWMAFASFFISRKTRFIKTEHSVFNERKDYKILRPLEILTYSGYHYIIGITSQVTDNLKTWLGKRLANRMVTIHNGVNLDQIRNEQANARTSEYDALFRSENFNILMVGRFDTTQKDQMSLVESLEYLPENTCVFFAGVGVNMPEVQKAVAEKNLASRVHFLGMRTDVYKLMSIVDLNVLSTNHEGLSGVVLESLASGRPFLGSDAVGVNNVVPDQSFLFNKKDPADLARKITSVMSDDQLRENLVTKAKQHVVQYDIKIMVSDYLNLYKRAVDER